MWLILLGVIGGFVFFSLADEFFAGGNTKSQKPICARTMSKEIADENKKSQAKTCTHAISKEFAASQLIGGQRFLQSYEKQLKSLAVNQEFRCLLLALRKELSGREMTDTRNANRRIADYFYINRANEKFPEVEEIVRGVVTYGKQASAHISIYYAMFLYD